MSKIVRLTAENFKILKAVEIAPDGNLVVIGGRNGQGKTSVLDCITAALGGVDNKNLPKPIRDGETSAQIILETEELVVTRRFTPSGSTVTVMTPEGAKFPKGQDKLNGLLGKLSLDPLAFTQLTAKAQLDALLGLVDLPFDPAALQERRDKGYAARTLVNAEVKRLAAQIEAAPEVGDELLELRNVNELIEESDIARKFQHHCITASHDVEQSTLRIQHLKEQLQDAEEDLVRARDELAELDAKRPTMRTAAEVAEDLAGVEDHNAIVRGQQAALQLVQQHAEAKAKADSYTAGIAAIDKEKAAGLKAATFPVDGLGFDTDGVTYNGIPFKQSSGAEQLRVSLAMAMAMQPELRVIRIADGSLLDEDNLKLVADMAAERDYQVWLEMVGSGAGGIIIEDGSVAE